MEDQMRVTVEEILTEARVRRRQEPGRRDGSKGGLDGGEHRQRGVGSWREASVFWEGDR